MPVKGFFSPAAAPTTGVVSEVLLLAGNSVCALKTFFFVQERYYDQVTGERM